MFAPKQTKTKKKITPFRPFSRTCVIVRWFPTEIQSGDSDLSLNPHRRVSFIAKGGEKKPRAEFLFFAEKKESGYFQIKRKREGNLVTAREKSRSSSSDRRSQLTERHSGAFQPRCFKKKEAQHRKKQSPTKLIHPVLHPYLNSSVHFAQFSADLDNIPNMTRS